MCTMCDGSFRLFSNTLSIYYVETALWDYLFLANYLWMIKFSVQKYMEKKI